MIEVAPRQRHKELLDVLYSGTMGTIGGGVEQEIEEMDAVAEIYAGRCRIKPEDEGTEG